MSKSRILPLFLFSSFFFLLGCGSSAQPDSTAAPGSDAGVDPAVAADAGDVPPTADAGDAEARSLSIRVAHPVLTMRRGNDAALPVTVTRTAFDAPVDIVLSGLPAGATAQAITVPAGKSDGAIALKTTTAVASGNHAVTITARSNGLTAVASLSLVISENAGLDPTFGTGGLVRMFLGQGAYRAANDLDVQPDAKIVLSGGFAPSTINADPTAIVYRLTDAGALDTTFGTAGELRLGTLGPAARVLVQPDGKIVFCAADQADDRLTLVRLTSQGALDTTFGAQGIARVPQGGPKYCFGLAIDASGRLLATASTTSGNDTTAWIARFQANGAPDPTFGTGGLASTLLGGARATLRTLRVTPQGIFAIGSRTMPNTTLSLGAVAKLDAQGNLDPTFGAGGVYEHKYGIFDLEVTAAGEVLYANQLDWFKLTPAGVLDTTWGVNGTLEASGTFSFSAGTMDAAGNLYRVRYSGSTGPGELWAYTAGGKIDPSFGTAGHVRLVQGNMPSSPRVRLGPDGRLVVLDSSNGGFWLQRFLL